MFFGGFKLILTINLGFLLLDGRYDDYDQRGEWYHDEPLDDYPEEDFTDDSESDGEQFLLRWLVNQKSGQKLSSEGTNPSLQRR